MITCKLRSLIKLRGLKQVDLANSIGISTSRLSLYISGKRKLDISMLTKIASYFDVDINYFIRSSDSSASNNSIKVPCVKLDDNNMENAKIFG